MQPNLNPTDSSDYSSETLLECNERLVRRVAQLEREVERARHLASHDPLTGLPNRALLLERLEQAMMQAGRQRKAVGLLLLDLDYFKSVNDRLGHQAGDRILQQVAERISGCIRGCDTACRYGGDEFVILLPEVRGTEDVEAVARKVAACLSEPYRVGEHVIAIAASVGTAFLKEEAASCRELIDAADSAMYRAKSRRLAAIAAGTLAVGERYSGSWIGTDPAHL
jgi:diguanylate cyclase (GGDEF)-like protein